MKIHRSNLGDLLDSKSGGGGIWINLGRIDMIYSSVLRASEWNSGCCGFGLQQVSISLFLDYVAETTGYDRGFWVTNRVEDDEAQK